MGLYVKQDRMHFKIKTLSIIVGVVLYSGTLWAQESPIHVQLASQPLAQSVDDLAKQANIEILYASDLLNQRSAQAISGNYTIEQVLQKLLQGSNLTIRKNGNIWSIVEKNRDDQVQNTQQLPPQEEVIQLAPMIVYGEKDRDTQGYDNVYDKNYSTVYAGKDLIERFKGTTPSDLFKGMSNVYSGDARNSGAIDPNIRGIQGQDRISVTIDGTEQSLTVWRGYGGANSRSYIDPNLISSISVVKGASLNSGVKTGIGGGVAATTLQIDDIVRSGQKYGAEIKVEGTSNSIKERVPQSYEGQDYRDVVEQLGITNWTGTLGNDPVSRVSPKTSDDNKLTNWDDKALRIAVGTKQEHFDLLAAYAYRSRGNYFAGKNGSDFYTSNGTRRDVSTSTGLVPYMATVYESGGEVTNTSNWMESYLLKGTWRPTDDQTLQFTYRDSTTQYGEIMPSRINWAEDGLPQWPLSNIDTKAYSLEYGYNPENSRWINLKANVWQTYTDSITYTTGGYINLPQANDYLFNSNLDLNNDGIRDRSTTGSYLIQNTARSVAENTRKGVSLTNKFSLLSNFGLTVGADLTREKLQTTDDYVDASGFRTLPRAGQRSENQYWFDFDWQPTQWLSLTAGAKSISYWSFDDYLNNSSGGTSTITKEVAKKLSYTINVDVYTQEMYDDMLANDLFSGNTIRRRAERAIGSAYTYTRIEYWYPDPVTGKYSAANNPLLNGTIDLTQENVTISTVTDGAEIGYSSITETVTTEVTKKKDHKNWAPAFSAAFQLNPNNRFYINYSEAYRLPSLFETTLGFSASQSGYDVEPEHAHSWELAYVYNLKDRLNLDNGQADIKLAYFRNKTENLIERDRKLVFTNIDQQKIAGFELAGRFDNGRYFGDLSLVWNKQNQVCDESSVLLLTDTNAVGLTKPTSYCVDYGFPAGYLVNMALPEYQANLTLGTRLFDQKLELGTRIGYFEGFKNPYIGQTDVGWFNAPLQWDNTWTVDAYTNYKYNEHLSMDLVGTNLGNRYYLDPLSRSAVPAPGRTFKLGLTYKF